MNDETLRLWKDFATRVFIPSALFFGAVSNLVNFIILSRPCIRACSMKIYLSVLAFTDTSMLMSIFLISKQFRDNAHSHEHELYWKAFGLVQWFHIAFVYISVYLTLFLVIDRYYISSKQQKAGEETCRISKAKNTASMVVFVCLLLSITAAFEIKLETKDFPPWTMMRQKQSSEIVASHQMNFSLHSKSTKTANEDEKSWKIHGSTTTKSTTNMPSHSHKMYNETKNDDVDDNFVANHRNDMTSGVVNDNKKNVASEKNHNSSSNISPSFHLFPVESDLARSKFYRVIFKPIASLLQLIPFVMMGFFMWKLAADVRRRSSADQTQPNQNIPHRQHQQQHHPDILIRDEQLSRLVIAIVVIFLICHTPNAVYSLCQATQNLFAATFASDDDNTTIQSDDDGRDGKKIRKSSALAFEILCLVLMCISCCSKLFLYLLAYDEFLASIKSFKTCFQHVSEQPANKVVEVPRKSLPQIFLTHSKSESKIANVSIPPRQRLTSVSIPVVDFIEHPSRAYPPVRRMSMMPSVSYGVYNPMTVQTTNELRQTRVNRQASTRSQRVSAPSTLANPSSSSQTNLTRCRSLAGLHSHMKHSPNCKLRKIIDNES